MKSFEKRSVFKYFKNLCFYVFKKSKIKMKNKIAIQGIKGSFHHQVALEYFNSTIEVDECLSFEALVDSLLSGKSSQAVMAIENSIAGSIIPNYALIDKNNLHYY